MVAGILTAYTPHSHSAAYTHHQYKNYKEGAIWTERFSLFYVNKKEHRLEVEQGIFKVRGMKAYACLEFMQDQ